MDTQVLEEQVQALDEGRAFMDGSSLRKIGVSGRDAAGWLNDLVTAGVEDLPEGQPLRSLLLAPTGHVRADFHVARTRERFVLLQDPLQPASIDRLLEPYVLSSDVALRDLGGELSAVLLPSTSGWTVAWSRPSEATEVTPEAAEAWRIRRGIPRFPVDFDEHSVPAEAGLEHLIHLSKGCFLGQESVAKIRNLGHPPRVILSLRAAGAARPGDRVTANGEDAGEVTSATPLIGGYAVLARVRWEARSKPLETTSRLSLNPA